MGAMSVATIKAPEFLNINSISPMISKCEIKVLYLGKNRNNSFITKEVATKMAETLPGSPIVGMFVEDKKDFFDHGERITIDGEGIKFTDMTKPYGFVAPDAKIWFQEFEDTDEFGNTIKREYLMSEGYLWTGQYEECKRVIEKGNPQSMKLNRETLEGHWSTDNNSGLEFFIINDATFENLCILGEDVEPCFEGADITNPKLSSEFSNENFMKSLFTMMEELKFTLSNKGGSSMDEVNVTTVEENAEVNTNAAVEAQFDAAVDAPAAESETVEVEQNSFTTPIVEETTEQVEDFAKKEDEEKSTSEDESPKSESETEEEEDKDKEDVKKKYELLQEEYSELETKFNALMEERDALADYKNKAEEAKKDALIDSFYMLAEEDKVDIRNNKANYSLEQIEEKLSVICVRKRVNFDLEDNHENESSIEENKNVTTYNLDAAVTESNAVPAYIAALRRTKDSRN